MMLAKGDRIRGLTPLRTNESLDYEMCYKKE